MTEKQRAVIARARKEPAQFITIRKGRFAAHFNMQEAQERKASDCLAAEQQRLIRLWQEGEL
jgi:hypothetical protein